MLEEGKGYTRHPRQVREYGIHIGQVQGYGVIRLLSKGKSGGGKRGKDQGVISLKYLVRLVHQQLAYLLGLGKIGVVVTGAQYKGAQQNASLDLPPEAFCPPSFIEGVQGGR